MNPEEKKLLERSLELSEENNRILLKMQRAARWGRVWGFIKLLIVAVPLIIGYLYLEPHIRVILDNLETIRSAVPTLGVVLPR